MAYYDSNTQPAAVTNGTDGTYYYYQEIRPFRYGVMQFTLSGGSGTVTVTVEATAEKDTAHASATYQDITSEYFGVASETSTGSFVFDTPIPWRVIRLKVVASTGGANDADWTVDFRFMD